jgi:hypothetical protein
LVLYEEGQVAVPADTAVLVASKVHSEEYVLMPEADSTAGELPFCIQTATGSEKRGVEASEWRQLVEVRSCAWR